jgi:hypothetical protein
MNDLVEEELPLPSFQEVFAFILQGNDPNCFLDSLNNNRKRTGKDNGFADDRNLKKSKDEPAKDSDESTG